MTKRVLMADSCDVAFAMSMLAGKWKIPILWKLLDGELRYGELRRRLPGIAEGVLITQLRELETDGLVLRKNYNELPPRVDYRVSEQGALLRPVLAHLDIWGRQHRTTLAA